VVAQEGSDLPGEIRTDEPDAGAIEAGVADRKLVCRGHSAAARPLLRPERLQDAQVLRHDLDLV
jgi:hypothetical protein